MNLGIILLSILLFFAVIALTLFFKNNNSVWQNFNDADLEDYYGSDWIKTKNEDETNK